MFLTALIIAVPKGTDSDRGRGPLTGAQKIQICAVFCPAGLRPIAAPNGGVARLDYEQGRSQKATLSLDPMRLPTAVG